MSVPEQILETVSTLPASEQLEVLNFAKAKAASVTPVKKRPRQDLRGALAHLNSTVSREDIAAMRREALRNFPRGDV